MAGTLYFRPGPLVKPSLDDARALGLSHAFTYRPTAREIIGRGPGPAESPGGIAGKSTGTPGVVFADASRMGDAAIGYYPDAQTWHQVDRPAGEPELYVGWYTDQPPTPADLLRAEPLPGVPVKLGDGREWLVPVLQEWRGDDDPMCRLPCPLTRRADGQWMRGDVVAAYRETWDRACQLWDVIIAAMRETPAGGKTGYAFAGLHDFACELLSINYAVSWPEVSALELFLPATAARVCEAAIDLPTFIDWVQKKTEAETPAGGSTASAGQTSSAGQGD